jgi:uncharacterized membrane-anchored protein
MKQKLLLSIITCCFPFFMVAETTDSSTVEIDSMAVINAFLVQDSIVQSLDYKTGKINLSYDLATINVPEGFSFLEGKDAQYVLEEVWGNPADADVLGLLLPKGVGLMDAGSWAIIYTYEQDGHIDDGDAADYDYAELLEEMKTQTLEGSAERVKMGYSAISLVGWAKSPYYDKTSHKLHWAKEIKFADDDNNTLNYNIRMLGRKGVLVMNIISGLDNMPTVEKNMNTILASTNFNAGNRYEDFDSKIDKVAEYGIGGLIAGGVLLKTGVLAKVGIFLLKGWKIIALAVAGIFAALKNKIFKRNKVE